MEISGTEDTDEKRSLQLTEKEVGFYVWVEAIPLKPDGSYGQSSWVCTDQVKSFDCYALYFTVFMFRSINASLKCCSPYSVAHA